ncbi:MAG: nucleoside recognition protein [Desulfuromonadales bacterium]|nr:nucleoside recognition protein [Desulfuromonadales bacterium]
MRLLLGIVILLLLFGASHSLAQQTAAMSVDGDVLKVASAAEQGGAEKAKSSRVKRVKPQGETGKALAAEKRKGSDPDSYKSWKRKLPFWPRKGLILFELMVVITIGVFIGQMLEVSGCVKMLSWTALPITGLGKLSHNAGPAFLMAFQSGAVANSMLVSQRDTGQISNRELYTSVYVVSALSLFAHLPTFVVPIGVAFGWEATIALFGVRFCAIAVQIILTLLLSRYLFARLGIGEGLQVSDQVCEIHQTRRKQGAFWNTVWNRSKRTLRRLLLYLMPTFVVMAAFEYYGAFKWLAATMPQLFTFEFLPPESVMVIPAQALSLYNGAIAAANFIDSGAITTHQAVIIILFGSMVTAPVRTLKHALPTYIAVLGPRPGTVMAVTAQMFRMFFLLLCTCALMVYWF